MLQPLTGQWIDFVPFYLWTIQTKRRRKMKIIWFQFSLIPKNHLCWCSFTMSYERLESFIETRILFLSCDVRSSENWKMFFFSIWQRNWCCSLRFSDATIIFVLFIKDKFSQLLVWACAWNRRSSLSRLYLHSEWVANKFLQDSSFNKIWRGISRQGCQGRVVIWGAEGWIIFWQHILKDV